MLREVIEILVGVIKRHRSHAQDVRLPPVADYAFFEEPIAYRASARFDSHRELCPAALWIARRQNLELFGGIAIKQELQVATKRNAFRSQSIDACFVKNVHGCPECCHR